MEQKIEKGIGFLQKLIALQNKYGFFSIIKGLFILLLSGYVVFFALNPTYLLEKIEKKSDVLIAPTIPYGSSPGLAPYPGSIDIDSEVLYQFCRQVFLSLYRHGARKFVFLNGHGGNIKMIQRLGMEFAGQEREFVSIARQQEIKAGLYLMLLQKREENAITLAATANNAKIIDEAIADDAPVAPRSKITYLIALILGVGIPVGVIYLLELTKFKIEGRADVEKLTSAPIVGDIPLTDEKQGAIAVFENQNNLMSETFRNVRTNLQFMLGNGKKVILVTSTVSGEGKSFISGNLAISLSLLGKKVVIVGLDIRKPGLNKVFNISKREQGITQYLANPEKNLMDLVQLSDVSKNLYILPGGTVPPNPTELLARDGLDKAIETLKKNFEYVILDTAPVGMVTDTLLIGRVADLSVYVCRADYTRKNEYTLINELIDGNKLPNLCTVINGLDLKKRKYGYYYGYGKYGKYYGYGKRYGYGYGYGEKHGGEK